MVSHVLACGLVLLAVDPSAATGAGPAGSAPEELRAYQAAKARVGRDPDAQVKLALWCEAHGLEAERVKHLALAVLTAPQHAAARGLLGLVAFRGRWQEPGAVAEQVRSDAGLAAALAEYNRRRQAAPDSADGQWQLGLWCERNGLKAEATAHFSAVVRLDPRRGEAWQHLGCRKHGNRWMTEAEIAAERADIEAQRRADRFWRPQLQAWRTWRVSRDPQTRGKAETALAAVTDPRAVPAIWEVFGKADADHQVAAVQLLGQVDAPNASRALALLAVFGESAEVRRSAAETIRHRDAREFAGLLIGLMRAPVRYEVETVGGPDRPGSLLVKGDRANLKRVYVPPSLPEFTPMPGDIVQYDSLGMPVVTRSVGLVTRVYSSPLYFERLQQEGMRRGIYVAVPLNIKPWGTVTITEPEALQISLGQLELGARRSAAATQRQLGQDVEQVERANAPIHQFNERIVPLLAAVSGLDFGEDREAWRGWLADQLGYSPDAQKADRASRPRGAVPTLVQTVAPTTPPPTVFAQLQSTGPPVSIVRISCFGAGTPVHTLTGTRPIETLAVGDLVLAQDTQTGALSYRPIVAVYHNPPSRTFRIAFDNRETIVSSPFHRFWRAGRGWTMARDLAVGDRVRTLDGLARVVAKDEDAEQLVYNLDVAEQASFFVGRNGLLVHDNTLPAPQLEPFDAEPNLAAVGKY